MATIKFNDEFALTDERSECQYGNPVIVKNGVAYGPGDMVDSGLFGMTPACDERPHCQRMSDDECRLHAKWQRSCGMVRQLTDSEKWFINYWLGTGDAQTHDR